MYPGLLLSLKQLREQQPQYGQKGLNIVTVVEIIAVIVMSEIVILLLMPASEMHIEAVIGVILGLY